MHLCVTYTGRLCAPTACIAQQLHWHSFRILSTSHLHSTPPPDPLTLILLPTDVSLHQYILIKFGIPINTQMKFVNSSTLITSPPVGFGGGLHIRPAVP